MESINICNNVVKKSSEYELNNSELKKRYIIKHIMLYNYIVSMINNNYGSFGTGYPFYALGQDLKGKLPVIDEQLRYNLELYDYILNSTCTIWHCKKCLEQNGHTMADLKQICKPCPKMPNEIKPRKVINRLPDIDMWMISKEKDIYENSLELAELLKENKLYTSDVDPLQTFSDFTEIVNDLNMDKMPEKMLPIDAHIIGYDVLSTLIEQVPEALREAKETNHAPYLPIQPLSYRKTWQYDDAAYNFVHDYLSSFTPYNIDVELKELLNDTRRQVAETYTDEELYNFLISSGPDSVLRRHRTKELKTRFEERIHSWRR